MSTRAWASCAVAVSGFSTITCNPACRHWLASAKWVETGVAMATPSSFRSSNSSTEPTVRTCGYARATVSRRAGLASHTAATWVRGQLEKLRTRFGPQYPYPIMPTRRRFMALSLVARRSDQVGEVCLGLAEVQAAGNENHGYEPGRQAELHPRYRSAQAGGPEGGHEPGHRVQVQEGGKAAAVGPRLHVHGRGGEHPELDEEWDYVPEVTVHDVQGRQ